MLEINNIFFQNQLGEKYNKHQLIFFFPIKLLENMNSETHVGKLALLETLINFKIATGTVGSIEQMHIARVAAHTNLRWKEKSETKSIMLIIFTHASSI